MFALPYLLHRLHTVGIMCYNNIVFEMFLSILFYMSGLRDVFSVLYQFLFIFSCLGRTSK